MAKMQLSENRTTSARWFRGEKERENERASERERKRLLVSVKSKQKKFEVAFGEWERSSLFAFARTGALRR